MKDKLIEEIAQRHYIQASVSPQFVGHAAESYANAIREYAAATNAAPDKPVAWIRFCSDGSYEGPLMDSAIEDVRKKSGAWTPLYAPAAPTERRSGEKERRKVLDLQRAMDLIGVLGEESRYGPADLRQTHSTFQNSEQTPQPSTAKDRPAAPSQEGVGQGGIAETDHESTPRFLREFGARHGNNGRDETSKIFGKAADKIEAQAARIEALVRERDSMGDALRDEVTARLNAEHRAESAEAKAAATQEILDHVRKVRNDSAEDMRAEIRSLRERLESAEAALAEAERLINRAVDIMTADQVGQWDGVRVWQERDTIDEARLREGK